MMARQRDQFLGFTNQQQSIDKPPGFTYRNLILQNPLPIHRTEKTNTRQPAGFPVHDRAGHTP